MRPVVAVAETVGEWVAFAAVATVGTVAAVVLLVWFWRDFDDTDAHGE